MKSPGDASREVAQQFASCLACGRSIKRGDPVIHIHGREVHLRCAIYRRESARR
jgi:hypothetical protein